MANQSVMYQRFFEEFKRHVPNLFKGRVLYIGANRHAAPTFVKALRQEGCEIHLLEAFSENVEHYQNVDTERFDSVTQGDVRELEEAGQPFDAILWWHGPEHLPADEWPGVLAKLETMAPLVCIGCPWGEWEQGKIGGNPYELHQSAIYPVQLKDLGYEVVLVGKRDLAGFIAGWKGETGGAQREGWYYAKLATSHTFWLVSGNTRRALRNVAELYSYGLYPVRVVSEAELEAIAIEGE
jgi:hypothetical protein